MKTIDKVLRAGLNLEQMIICFNDDIISHKSLSGQGEELMFKDGSEFIIDDSGNYIYVYEQGLDIYTTYELQGNCYRAI